jgi:hypothetical protein
MVTTVAASAATTAGIVKVTSIKSAIVANLFILNFR